MIVFTYIGMFTVGAITLFLLLWSVGVIKFDTKIQKPKDDEDDKSQ